MLRMRIYHNPVSGVILSGAKNPATSTSFEVNCGDKISSRFPRDRHSKQIEVAGCLKAWPHASPRITILWVAEITSFTRLRISLPRFAQFATG
jgi:hypothetical protein